MAKKNCHGQLVGGREMNLAGDPTDRLSHLLDFVLYHILSFISTIAAVRTSVLSRRWKCVWKHLPVLYFHSSPFEAEEDWDFGTFVDKVLSLRYQLKVDKLTYVDARYHYDLDLYRRAIEYVVSHHTQHLDICTNNYDIKFSELFGSSALNCDQEMLILLGVYLDIASSCFRTLTTLKLTCCTLDLQEGYLNCSLNLPCLTSLYIMDLTSDRGIKVYAPQLLNLVLCDSEHLSIEIVAPRLKFCTLQVWCPGGCLGVPKLVLPYVNHVDISVEEAYSPSEEKLVPLFNALFPCLHRAKSLLVHCKTTKALPLICKFIEQARLSFTRLESLVCMSNKPHEVVDYLAEGSSDGEPNVKQFRRL